MRVAFAGHSNIFGCEDLKEAIKVKLRENITNTDNITVFLGGYGDFDNIRAYAIKELKQEYANIERIYITPYISTNEQRKISEMQKDGLCDTSLYPPIENVPLRYAIKKRNEWMMRNSDLIICYIKHTYGGAYDAIKVAKRGGKRIINLYSSI